MKKKMRNLLESERVLFEDEGIFLKNPELAGKIDGIVGSSLALDPDDVDETFDEAVRRITEVEYEPMAIRTPEGIKPAVIPEEAFERNAKLFRIILYVYRSLSVYKADVVERDQNVEDESLLDNPQLSSFLNQLFGNNNFTDYTLPRLIATVESIMTIPYVDIKDTFQLIDESERCFLTNNPGIESCEKIYWKDSRIEDAEKVMEVLATLQKCGFKITRVVHDPKCPCEKCSSDRTD